MDSKTRELITEIVELAESLDLEPKEALEILNAQDWEDDEPVYSMDAVTVYED